MSQLTASAPWIPLMGAPQPVIWEQFALGQSNRSGRIDVIIV
jgi:hypothetical protein